MNFFLGWVVGIVLGVTFALTISSSYEEDSCKDLEAKLNVNLVYTFNGGCKLAEDM